jgi:short-subunit dehydrogenase
VSEADQAGHHQSRGRRRGGEGGARRDAPHQQTNFFGTLSMTRAFAPVLKRNGGGAIVNMLSVLSWFKRPALTAHAASKSAEWALTNGIRNELRGLSAEAASYLRAA